VKIIFKDEPPNPANLQVKTPIKRVTIKGGTVEVEFNGEPDQNELQTIAEKLKKSKIIRKLKKHDQKHETNLTQVINSNVNCVSFYSLLRS